MSKDEIAREGPSAVLANEYLTWWRPQTEPPMAGKGDWSVDEGARLTPDRSQEAAWLHESGVPCFRHSQGGVET